MNNQKGLSSLDEGYWSKRYSEGRTGWDLGQANQAILKYADSLSDKTRRILIPGAGNAYDWAHLQEAGYHRCFALDISQAPLEELAQQYPQWSETLINADFFQHEEKYDLILEQTFFCALDPQLRENYVAQIHRCLHEEGRLAGVLFNRTFEHSGPPFGGDEQEYRSLFAPYFDFLIWEPCKDSHPARLGSEWAFELRKKPVLGT